ncbi:MAG: hypothetical protein P4N41_07835 [Negativicutes bacterium]|nr:hypothetical protein [Negativicutes bacterium]
MFKKMAFIIGILAAVVSVFPCPGAASPLTDFSRGAAAVDVSYNIHTFEGFNNSYSFGLTTGLGNDWAFNFRQAGYDPVHNSTLYDAINREFNVVRKIDDTWQLYGGFSTTSGSGNAAFWHKNVIQGGVIGTKKLNDRTTFFVNMGGGWNVANVEFGFSYQLQPGLEISSIYRHLTVEKIEHYDDKLNMRCINLGVTWKR